MQPADRPLDAGLGRRQPAHRPQGQQRRGQGSVAGAQTGELAQHRLGAPGHAAQASEPRAAAGRFPAPGGSAPARNATSQT